jgi:hypothetical protein
LLTETNDIQEELGMMIKVYQEQKKALQDFRRHLARFILELDDRLDLDEENLDCSNALRRSRALSKAKELTSKKIPIREADDLLRQVSDRETEFRDMESTAYRASQQVVPQKASPEVRNSYTRHSFRNFSRRNSNNWAFSPTKQVIKVWHKDVPLWQ